MMTRKTLSTSLIVTLITGVSLAAPLLASAQVSSSGRLATTVGSGMLHIDLGVGANADADASANADANADMSAGGTGSATMGATGSATAGASGSMSGSGSSAQAIQPDAVQSDTDLTAFTKAEFAGDSNVHAVDASAQSVSLTYNDHAHFLGLFPTTAQAVATVKADGSIAISYPWYGFLLSTHRAEIKAQLQDIATNNINAAASASANASLSAAQKARILRGMHSILESQLSADAATDASGSASY